MLVRPLFAVAIAAAASAQSDVLFYKFEGGGSRVVNYASASPAPAEGTLNSALTTPPTTPFVPGRFGEALQGGSAVTPYQPNYVDTGWAPNVTSSYTWAMWLYNSRANPAPTLSYICGIPTGLQFRVYTGATTLLTTGNAGGTSSYRTVANIYGMATAGWVHVAFVADTSTMMATYYINGAAETPLTLAGAPAIVGTAFNVGRQLLTAAPSIYDIDEFRFLTRAASAAEIASWANANSAGDGTFGQGCDAMLASSNGPPTIGNALYGFTATGPLGGVGNLTIGLSRTSIGGLPLPLDLGLVLPSMTGCQWLVGNDLGLFLVLGAGGVGTQPLPIPSIPGLDGLDLYAQALLLGGPRGYATSNAVAFSIGN